MSRHAQLQKGIQVDRLDRYNTRTDEWIQVMVEDRHTPIPDRVAFRIDVPAWFATLSDRDREIATELATGESPGEVARAHHLSPGKVSQIRRELHESWKLFCEDQDSATTAA